MVPRQQHSHDASRHGSITITAPGLRVSSSMLHIVQDLSSRLGRGTEGGECMLRILGKKRAGAQVPAGQQTDVISAPAPVGAKVDWSGGLLLACEVAEWHRGHTHQPPGGREIPSFQLLPWTVIGAGLAPASRHRSPLWLCVRTCAGGVRARLGCDQGSRVADSIVLWSSCARGPGCARPAAVEACGEYGGANY